MRTANHSWIQQQALGHPPLILKQRMMVLLFLLVAATTTAIEAVPTRLFNSNENKLTGLDNQAQAQNNFRLPNIIPEEELELESLKGSGASGKSVSYSGAKAATKKSVNSPSAIEPPSTSILTTNKPVYMKKPENEETPALSDNANSLKYGGAHAELEEALANLAHIPPSKSPSLSVSAGPLGESILQQQKKRTRSSSGMELSKGAGPTGVNLDVDYTPRDIAEYIFWMGDEHSVELAINDFIQDGLITPQEAIKFLEEVKAELSSLKSRFAMGHAGMDENAIRTTWDAPVRQMRKKQSTAKSSFLGSGGGYPSSNAYDMVKPYYNSATRNNGMGVGDGYTSSKDWPQMPGMYSLEDLLDYEEVVEKLKQQRESEMELPTLRRRENALHGIIYKLAREMFSMGLQQSPGTSVPKFTTFIENLAVNGEISKDMEKSVLEILVQALVDAANEEGLLGTKSSSSLSTAEQQLSNMINRKLASAGNPMSQTKPIVVKKKSA